MSRFVFFMVIGLAVALPACIEASEELFDAEVVYADGKIDTIFNVHETLDRGYVRILCYIDGDARPRIPYGEISTISFARSDRDGRKMALTITLYDDTVKHGTLWGNDSFFGTAKGGAEWRGRIVNLSRLSFMPSTVSSDESAPRHPAHRGGSSRP